jgi:hypothetical protein
LICYPLCISNHLTKWIVFPWWYLHMFCFAFILSCIPFLLSYYLPYHFYYH